MIRRHSRGECRILKGTELFATLLPLRQLRGSEESVESLESLLLASPLLIGDII